MSRPQPFALPSPALAGAVAAVVLIVPVVAEILVPSFGDSGHLVFATSQLVGWALVASVCISGLRAVPRLRQTRAGRLGGRSLLAGCACQVAFTVVYGVSAAVSGEPLEAAFVLFLLGFLAQLVGGIAWARSLLRAPAVRRAGLGVLATAVLGFLAIAVGVDPFHDVFLLSSYAAWAVVGWGLAVVADPGPESEVEPGVPGRGISDAWRSGPTRQARSSPRRW